MPPRRSGVKDGLCFVSPMHITAAVYVNGHESGLAGVAVLFNLRR